MAMVMNGDHFQVDSVCYADFARLSRSQILVKRVFSVSSCEVRDAEELVDVAYVGEARVYCHHDSILVFILYIAKTISRDIYSQDFSASIHD